MTRYRKLTAAVALLLISLCLSAEEKKTSYVDPFIGTAGNGGTHPGAVIPNGMMSVTPFNVMGSSLNTYDKDSRWWTAPYSNENRYLTGFSHLNLSGAECPEGGSLLTMATTGPMQADHHIYGTEYTDEYAVPGYYSATLLAYNIKAEMTATARTSIERYTFPKGRSNIFINLGEGLSNESGAFIRQVSETEIEGMKIMGPWCYTPDAVFPVFFVMKVSKCPIKSGAWKKQEKIEGTEAAWMEENGSYKFYPQNIREIAGDHIGWNFTFDTVEDETIYVKMGLSFVSCENARENLETEQNGFNFNEVRRKAEACWEKTLGRIDVFGATPDITRTFYTALYHANIHPSILNDCNGEYPAAGTGKTLNAGKHVRYSLLPLGNTCRSLSQLMALVYPEKQEEIIRSMIGIYEESGWMPENELFSREIGGIPGDPAITVIADSWLKGIRGFDIERAYEAFIKSADTFDDANPIRPGISTYLTRGHFPIDDGSYDLSDDISVSEALECYTADHALALLSEDLGKHNAAERFNQRTLSYKEYFCKETGTFRPRHGDGSFLSPFRPELGKEFMPAPGFYEGSAITWSFDVPWDVEGLATLMGGRKNFVKQLWNLFEYRAASPSSGPAMHYPFMFSHFRGEEWRTQEIVNRFLKFKVTDTHDGLPDNDRYGSLSSWIVFAMMGINPYCPGEPGYIFSTPSFANVTIHLDPEYCNGQTELKIRKNFGRYIKGIKVKGKPHGFLISHNDLLSSGLVEMRCTLDR